jgi:putative hydrolase
MKHPKVFFVSHPDDSKNPLSYERLVQAAKEYHVALEVNNSSFLKESRLNRDDNYRTMLACCVKYQVPVIVSSDAHDPSWAGVFDDAIAFLEAEHFPEELILTKDEQRVLEFIGLDESVFR